jgi:hypothetical protein
MNFKEMMGERIKLDFQLVKKHGSSQLMQNSKPLKKKSQCQET